MGARVKDPETGLTDKQEQFCQMFVKMASAAGAYRVVYSSRCKVTTAQNEGWKLLQNPAVAARVKQIRETIRCHVAVDVEDLLAELEETRSLALAMGQASAAQAAIMAKAKLLGLDQQIIDHRSSDGSMKPTTILLQGVEPNVDSDAKDTE